MWSGNNIDEEQAQVDDRFYGGCEYRHDPELKKGKMTSF